MGNEEKDLEAGVPSSETKETSTSAAARDPSPVGSITTEVDYDKLKIPAKRQATPNDNSVQDVEKAEAETQLGEDAYETEEDLDDDDDTDDHGEPDIEHLEAEEAVLGRDLDRQLSKVGGVRTISPGANTQRNTLSS